MSEEKKHEFTYYINGEEQHTSDNKQTMREVVEKAGFTPADDYEMEDDNNHKKYANPDEEVHLHEGQHLTVTYKGTTPTS